jgi:hypothetical protein
MIYIVAAILFVALIVCVVISSAWIVGLRAKLKEAAERSILDDLEFATSEQLMKELRGRPNNIYIMLTPIENKTEQGIKIELNNMKTYDGVSMLHLASIIIHREMKARGMETPKLQSIEEIDGDIEEKDEE